mmetsp:Transcript_3402/g.2856  ORF Transcript_3402/g.2856 Transcript_3402/m.2856 type:complete len:133 (+) Transcript_3402:1-399(+)
MKTTSKNFACSVYTIIKMFFEKNPQQTGSKMNDKENDNKEGEDLEYRGLSASNYPDEKENRVFKGIEKYSKGRLCEDQIRKIWLLNSLLKIQSHLSNSHECMISALVYIDKLSQTDDDILSCNSNWILLCCI